MTIRHVFLLAPIALAVALAGCSSDDDRDFDAAAEARAERAAANPPAAAVFDPTAGAAGLPFPIDIVFLGSEDGTINIDIPVVGEDGMPVAMPSDEQREAARNELSNPLVALNLMDGFSTVAPITAGVTAALDPASLRVGDTIRVFELETDAMFDVTGLGTELGPERIAAIERDGTLALVPLTPLSPATQHAVYVTDGVLGADGTPLAASSAFAFARGPQALAGNDTPGSDEAVAAFGMAVGADLPALEPLRQYVRPLVDLVQTAENPPGTADIALAWSFRTQGVTEVLGAVAEQASAKTLIVGTNGATTALVPGGAGIADVYVGALDVPYYLVPVVLPSDREPTDQERLVAAGQALNSFWRTEAGNVVTRYTPAPSANGRPDQKIPVLMTVPNETSGMSMPEAGWPVVIFQHGITQNRTNALAVSEAMARAGFAVIAIDMPLHGIVGTEPPFGDLRADERGLNPFVNGERTFDVDVLTQNEQGDILATAPDGNPDSSGSSFYNLRNLVNSRDNLRQAVADLLTLSRSLDGGVLVAGADGTPTPFPIDASRKAFFGHSLGGIVGTTFLAFDPSVQSATLAMPGGGIAQLLANSAAFGPSIRAGVNSTAEGGVSDAEFQQFLAITQTLVDSGDPINHAATVAANGNAAVHLIEVVGEAGVSLPDLVIPNAVAGAPLAGTEPLARELGLDAIAESGTGSALVRFSRGTHGSILDPTSDPTPDGIDLTDEEGATGLAVTTEMQTQAATFAATVGMSLPITDASVIAPLDVEIEEATLPVLPMPGETETETTTGARP